MKRILAFMLALSLIIGLCACSPSSEERRSSSKKDKTEEPFDPNPEETDDPDYDGTPKEFVGTWRYEDREGYLNIYDDWLWSLYDEDCDCIQTGGCRLEEGYGLVLENGDGTDYDYLQPNGDGTLYNSSFTVLHPAELPDESDADDAAFADYAGPWYSEDAGIYLYIYDDMTWATYDEGIQYLAGGTCRLEDGFGLVLENFDDTDYDYLKFGDDGLLYNSSYCVYVRCGDFLYDD